jgi:hypothetical protein
LCFHLASLDSCENDLDLQYKPKINLTVFLDVLGTMAFIWGAIEPLRISLHFCKNSCDLQHTHFWVTIFLENLI